MVPAVLLRGAQPQKRTQQSAPNLQMDQLPPSQHCPPIHLNQTIHTSPHTGYQPYLYCLPEQSDASFPSVISCPKGKCYCDAPISTPLAANMACFCYSASAIDSKLRSMSWGPTAQMAWDSPAIPITRLEGATCIPSLLSSGRTIFLQKIALWQYVASPESGASLIQGLVREVFSL